MSLAIMQPYFFPYIGYFQLMNVVDEWVIFDDIQFIDKGWINRNRILHPNPKKAWQYITVPLSKRGQFENINHVFIANKENWVDSIFGKLTIYKKAPYYSEVIEFLHECFLDMPEELSVMLESTLRKTASYLGVSTKISVSSREKWVLPEIDSPGQWALEISKIKKANRYINLYGGSAIFSQSEFDKAGIELEFLKPILNPYPQYRGTFEKGLSIIDVMMWNSKESIQRMLKNDFSLLRKSEL